MTTYKFAATPTRLQSVGGLLRKVALLLLILPLGVFQGCEKDSDTPPETDKPTPPSGTYSVRIGASNQNLPGPGTLTLEYSDFLSGGDLNRAVDNNLGTKLILPHDKFYILWKGDSGFVANSYYLTSADDSPQSDPKTWTLSASIDGTSWIVLDTRTDQTFTERKTTLEFPIPEDDTAYIYYKLEIVSNNGSANTQIAEWGIRYLADINSPTSITVNSNKNMPGSGQLSVAYSDAPEAHSLDKLIDDMKSTSFLTYHDEFDITWTGDAETAVTVYSLMSSVNKPENDPKSWTLYGSIDGEAWTALHTQKNYTFIARKQKKWFRLDNTTAYKYYKLSIEANNGGGFTEIAEMQLLNIDMDISLILAKAKAHTSEGALTAMGHFFNFRANTPTTAEERAWLGDPAQEPTGERCNVPNDYPPLINFEVDLYPFGKPMMADANQRGIGDCCAIATFSALAYCYPDFIQSIITDNGDDTYTVKMYDPNRERIDVCVSNKFWAGDPSYLSAAAGKGATQATWATVLEKALMKYREVYYGIPNLGGIGTPDVAPPFTGCGYGYAYNFNSAVLTPEDWHRLVQVLLIEGHYLVGGFWVPNIPLGGGVSITGHAFAFMHSTDPTALFAMRNPWGNGDADGLLTMPSGNTVLTAQTNVWIFEPGEVVSEFGIGVIDGYSYPYDL